VPVHSLGASALTGAVEMPSGQERGRACLQSKMEKRLHDMKQVKKKAVLGTGHFRPCLAGGVRYIV
jgi:hypothetical protein